MERDHEFLVAAEAAIKELKGHLSDSKTREPSSLGIEELGGGLQIHHPISGERFLVTHHLAERQIWVSAPGSPSSEFQLNWDSRMEQFILPSTGETIIRLVDRILSDRH
jgi:frataxin-like iron-binding protein CyaY